MVELFDPDEAEGDYADYLQGLWEYYTRDVGDVDEILRELRIRLTQVDNTPLQDVGGPQIAAILAIAHGAEGLNLLAYAARTAWNTMLCRVAVDALWSAACGKPAAFDAPGRIDQETLSDELRSLASDLLDDLIVESPQYPDLFWACLSLAHDVGDKDGFAARFMRASADATIRLTRTVLNQFAELIDGERPEAEYQEFLQTNPVILDPLAAEVFPTAPLGLEFRTDFVIRRHDGRYVVVEIERPQDALLTVGHDFAGRMTHAVGQVMDFQQWVADNVAYAQTRFPGIAEPAGLLVMGMRTALDARGARKIARWQTNSRHIELVTYDELLARGRALLKSLRR
ncbi:Shedu anti-phage system protein SduA domain-containing protein [Catellatospora vulcania]|uniref:Shedu anti-phage system protein SduA domain-containing protein n=1 Tax=Catellatospora vulcania TaxID=1460450 RepID=UPI0012D4348B|nr:Shedu anti-phage system protein SduA domain-containing protein [Catellatospora vulcania]